MSAKSKNVIKGYEKWFNEQNLENVFAVAKRVEPHGRKKSAKKRSTRKTAKKKTRSRTKKRSK